MNAKSFQKIRLLFVNVDKFTYLNLPRDQLLRSTDRSLNKIYRDEYLEVNQQQTNFQVRFGIHYHLCEISAPIIECII